MGLGADSWVKIESTMQPYVDLYLLKKRPCVGNLYVEKMGFLYTIHDYKRAGGERPEQNVWFRSRNIGSSQLSGAL